MRGRPKSEFGRLSLGVKRWAPWPIDAKKSARRIAQPIETMDDIEKRL